MSHQDARKSSPHCEEAVKGKRTMKFYKKPKNSKTTRKQIDYSNIEKKCPETLKASGDLFVEKKAHRVRFLSKI